MMKINETNKNFKKLNGVSLILSVGFIVFFVFYSFVLNKLPFNFFIYLSLPFVSENMSYLDKKELIENLFYFYCQALTLITVLIIFLKFKNDSISSKKTKISFKLIFIGICFGIVTIILSILSSLIYSNLIGNTVTSENTNLVIEEIKKFPIMMLSTVIIAPILEEITFKAGIFTFFHEIFREKNKFLNLFLPAIISALIFSSLHDGIELIPIYFLPSFLGCILYKKTNSIIPCVVGHFVNNLFITFLIFL